MKKIYPFLLALIFVCSWSCVRKQTETPAAIDYAQIAERDTLVAATLYGSSSYFIFKGEEMGFDYELCARFAKEQGLALRMVLADTPTELVDLLNRQAVDLIACRLPITNELKQSLTFTHNEYVNNQVLVQRSSPQKLNNQVELIGKTVVVNAGTKYETRLRNLNDEIGGGINIELAADSLTTDNLIEMVSTAAIDFTVAENDVALLNKTYFRNLDCRLPISFNQRAAWAVRRSSPELAARLNEWFDQQVNLMYYNTLYNKYFVQAKYFDARTVSIPKGAISPYDGLFRHYASQLGWDWQLLAAIAHEESRFDTAVVSWVGAKGLMQMMPRTAAAYGVSEDDLPNPDSCLRAATLYLKQLNRIFSKVENKDERIKFILASYNGGHSHVLDAQALAAKYGKDKFVWQGNVEEYLLLKSHSEYYNDPVVRSGYFRADQTVKYVNEVLRIYEEYMGRK